MSEDIGPIRVRLEGEVDAFEQDMANAVEHLQAFENAAADLLTSSDQATDGVVDGMTDLADTSVDSMEQVVESVRKGGDALAEFDAQAQDMLRSMQSSISQTAQLLAVPMALLKRGSLQAWAAQEAATVKLTAALTVNEQAVDRLMPKYNEFANQMQIATTFGDSLTTSTMAQMHTMGVVSGHLEKATKAAMGLAAAYGMDLRTAGLLVARAQMGQTQMLVRYGIVLDEHLSKEEKFQQLLKIGEKNFKLNELQVESLQGALAQLSNRTGDVSEAWGQMMAEGLGLVSVTKSVEEHLRSVQSTLESLTPSQKSLVATLTTTAVVVPSVALGLQVLVRAKQLLYPATTKATMAMTLSNLTKQRSVSASAAAVIANGKLTASFVTLTAGAKAAAIAIGPFGWAAIAIGTASFAIVAHLEKANKQLEGTNEALGEINALFKDVRNASSALDLEKAVVQLHQMQIKYRQIAEDESRSNTERQHAAELAERTAKHLASISTHSERLLTNAIARGKAEKEVAEQTEKTKAITARLEAEDATHRQQQQQQQEIAEGHHHRLSKIEELRLRMAKEQAELQSAANKESIWAGVVKGLSEKGAPLETIQSAEADLTGRQQKRIDAQQVVEATQEELTAAERSLETHLKQVKAMDDAFQASKAQAVEEGKAALATHERRRALQEATTVEQKNNHHLKEALRYQEQLVAAQKHLRENEAAYLKMKQDGEESLARYQQVQQLLLQDTKAIAALELAIAEARDRVATAEPEEPEKGARGGGFFEAAQKGTAAFYRAQYQQTTSKPAPELEEAKKTAQNTKAAEEELRKINVLLQQTLDEQRQQTTEVW